jgi:hypothetical protein
MAKTIRLGEKLAGDLRAVADSLSKLAETVEGSVAASEPPADGRKQPEAKTQPAALTLEDVRAVLAELSRDGHTSEIRELLRAHGADRLSEIDPSEYAALLKDAEGLR